MIRLAVSTGDPAGVGPEVATRAILARPQNAYRVFGDAGFMSQLGSQPNVELVDVARWSEATRTCHAPSPEGGAAQLAALDAAIAATRAGECDALVTAPVSKEAIVSSGEPFIGHTERLADACGLPVDGVSMLFIGPRLAVGLVTTHLSVRDATRAITPARVARTIEHLVAALQRLGRTSPRVWVAGLNPHASEHGLFGDEEASSIVPGMNAASTTGIVEGPIPSESAFRAAAEGRVDGVVAMLHDQATIASKLLDWGKAVNVTWGLPIVRTSVDHGVAYDAAQNGTADPAGMIAAVDLAARLSE